MLGLQPVPRGGLLLKSVFIVLSVILLTIVATTSVSSSQGPSPEVLQTLSQNPKLKFPQAILEPFAEGSSTTRVIVILRDPSVQAQAQEKTAGSTAVNRNLRNMEVRQQLQNEVRAGQDRVINTLNEERVRVTNRFTYILGFSAEVTPEGLQDLLDNPDVVSVEEDTVIHAHLAQGIPLMNASTVRSTYNGSGIAIAICDSGIDYTHPRLGNGGFPNSKVIGGYDTGQNDNNPMDGNGHGTACAGIAAGNLGTTGDYIGGVAYNAKLYALKITSTSTNGSAYDSDMVEAWEWCVTHQDDDPANPIMIISTSFGGGRYVTFRSSASNLVSGDTNGVQDIFVHDRQTGETTRASVASDGSEADSSSYNPSISADGRYAAFESLATNLVPGDTNGSRDIFVLDRQTNQTTRASVASNGSQGDSDSYYPRISADGRYVAFYSYADNLAPGDANGYADVFVRDRHTGQTTLVSVASDGTQGNSASVVPSISPDGRYVAFHSPSTNLVAGDTNGYLDVFVHDRQTGQTIRVSVAADGSQGNAASYTPSISAAGSYVAFYSHAENLVPGDTNGQTDVFCVTLSKAMSWLMLLLD